LGALDLVLSDLSFFKNDKKQMCHSDRSGGILISSAFAPKIRRLLTKKAAKLLLLNVCSYGIFT
jgi:hypothetical protein